MASSDGSWEYIYRCVKRRATIVLGDDGAEKIKGTKKADVIVGNGGKDKLKGSRRQRPALRRRRERRPDRSGAGKKDRLIGGPGKDKQKQ